MNTNNAPERIKLPELTPQQIEDALADTEYAGSTAGHWVNDCGHVRLVPLGRVDGGPVYHLFNVKYSKNIQDGWSQNTQIAADAKLNAARAFVLARRLAAMQPQVSEGDSRQGVPEVWPDDVLTDMDNAWRKATDVRRVGHYETLMAVAAAAIRGLARHRQPAAFTKEEMEEVCENTHHAAVSADAVKLAKDFLKSATAEADLAKAREVIQGLVEVLKNTTDCYEWACLADLGVRGFRELDDESTEDEIGWEGMGEECDADAIDNARNELTTARNYVEGKTHVPHVPHTAQQSEEVIAKALGNHLTVVKEEKLNQMCPECGSGDIGFCEVSVRPYCRECNHWAPVNCGSKADAIRLWNAKLEESTAPAQKGGE